eukprot:2604081-Prymnesium_polylepis.1
MKPASSSTRRRAWCFSSCSAPPERGAYAVPRTPGRCGTSAPRPNWRSSFAHVSHLEWLFA